MFTVIKCENPWEILKSVFDDAIFRTSLFKLHMLGVKKINYYLLMSTIRPIIKFYGNFTKYVPISILFLPFL